jgi:predicted nucleic acid-binding protein
VTLPKLVVHTDVILDHLHTPSRPSAMRRAMGGFLCYTTVFNAIEVFASCQSPPDRKAAEDAMSAMKLLGLNPKNAMRYGDLFDAHPRLRPVDLLVAGMCVESKLPLLTDRRQDFRGIRGLRIVATRELHGGTSTAGIVNTHQR